MVTLILFIVIFGVVVISHEFGHFLLAKANGIHVVEFAVGMGPSLFSFQKGETKYSLKLFPIGGACMFEGEDGLEAKEGEIGEGSFLNASVWGRISTVVAGPFFNFILGFVIALIMVNMIVIREPVATEVLEGSAALEAGMQDGDRILSLNGERMYLYEEIQLFTQIYSGGDVTVEYERDGERYSTVLTPKLDESTGRYMLGISNAAFVELSGLDGLRYAWYEMRYSILTTYKSLGMLLKGQVTRQDVAGPVGIAVNLVGKTYENTKEYGWQNVLVNMLNITLMLSVNLGILNLLPIPALDGGRLVFLLIEVIRGKPIPPDKEGMVHFVGLMFFMALMVFLLFNDLSNIFG
ncbi:MAG: RIP metalloprotease RseP [Candidatus Gastranaerophilales bacterium]|nr:RIP metalloprotease RseP [Candidatus Gastranaerophilales bacterium]